MRGFALAAGVLVAAALSGCGAHVVEDSPSLDEVAAATRSDPYWFKIAMRSEGLPDGDAVTVTGAADAVSRSGFVRYAFDDAGADMAYEMRQIGTDTYMRMISHDLPDGWTKMSAAEDAYVLREGPFGTLSEPHNLADALAQHGQDVFAEPGEPVDGVATTHYRADVPTLELLGAQLTGKEREELEDEIRKSRSESTKVEAWAGSDGVLRRLVITIPVTEEGHTGRVIASIRFFDFGKPVDVEAPAVSELEAEEEEVTSRPEVSEGPCAATTAPHTPENVIAALRKAGFDVSAECIDDETTIFATPKNKDESPVVVCSVVPGPEPSDDYEGAVIAGNVACGADTSAARAALRTVLDGL